MTTSSDFLWYCIRCGGETKGGTYLGDDGPYCGYCMAQLPKQNGPTLDDHESRIKALEEMHGGRDENTKRGN